MSIEPIGVVALDPGGTTGVSYGLIKDGYMEINSGQDILSPLGLYKFLSGTPFTFLICETFEYRNQSRAGLVLTSVELIGVVKLYQEQRGIPDEQIFWQPASDQREQYWSIEKMKNAGVWVPGHQHAMSACRHLLTWYNQKSGYQYNKAGYGPSR